MISTFTAFIDANVFYGARLRSLVLFLAQTKLFRARWSDTIHEEWIRNLIRNRPDLTPKNLEATRAAMNAAVPDCLVTGYEHLIVSIDLPDEDDQHVVAAAVMTRANVIVTFNLKDFPDDVLHRNRLHAKHPDEFLLETFDLEPVIFLEAVKTDFQHYRTPPLQYKEYLDSLIKAGVPKIAKILEEYEILMVDEEP